MKMHQVSVGEVHVEDPSPMKRGLKENKHAHRCHCRIYVEDPSPMKRGLKAVNQAVGVAVPLWVEDPSPMKRGLKDGLAENLNRFHSDR